MSVVEGLAKTQIDEPLGELKSLTWEMQEAQYKFRTIFEQLKVKGDFAEIEFALTKACQEVTRLRSAVINKMFE